MKFALFNRQLASWAFEPFYRWPQLLLPSLFLRPATILDLSATCGSILSLRPLLPEFGRNIYYTELADLISDPLEQEEPGEKSQLDVLGVRWPSKPRTGAIGRARSAYKESVQNQSFRAIIFDYDGTLCSSQRKDQPPSEDVLDGLLQILQNGVKVGIASGRGDSINEILQERIPLDYREQVILGLYNGGHVANLGEEVPKGPESCEFLNHALRIVRKLQSLGVPIDAIRPTIPYQISIRFREGVDTETMWYVIGDSMRQAGLDPSRMVCSKHSIDILGDGISKDRVLAHIIQIEKIDPYEIITIGDQGAWPGNDCSLLEHRYSLSVDIASRRLDRGWNLSPPHKRDVDATLWYLSRVQHIEHGKVRFNLD